MKLSAFLFFALLSSNLLPSIKLSPPDHLKMMPTKNVVMLTDKPGLEPNGNIKIKFDAGTDLKSTNLIYCSLTLGENTHNHYFNSTHPVIHFNRLSDDSNFKFAFYVEENIPGEFSDYWIQSVANYKLMCANFEDGKTLTMTSENEAFAFDDGSKTITNSFISTSVTDLKLLDGYIFIVEHACLPTSKCLSISAESEGKMIATIDNTGVIHNGTIKVDPKKTVADTHKKITSGVRTFGEKFSFYFMDDAGNMINSTINAPSKNGIQYKIHLYSENAISKTPEFEFYVSATAKAVFSLFVIFVTSFFGMALF